MSSFVSPSPPPIAGCKLLNAKEDWTVDESVASKLFPKNVVLIDDASVNDWAGTFDSAPPPVKYSIVNVVFEGANP